MAGRSVSPAPCLAGQVLTSSYDSQGGAPLPRQGEGLGVRAGGPSGMMSAMFNIIKSKLVTVQVH